MKVAMVGFVGMSPAVMTEMARFLIPEGLTDVIMLPTRDDFVIASSRLVEAALKVTYPKVRVHIHFLPMKDVTTEKENIEAAKHLAKAILEEKLRFSVDKIFLNIAGGRKETTAMAMMIGEFFGVTAVYHVVNRDVRDMNLYQQKIKEDIMKFSEPEIEERIKMYKEDREKFDYLLFPQEGNLEFIRIPIIPRRLEEISFLKRLLHPGGVNLMEECVDLHTLEIYRMAGLIAYDKYHAWPTDIGEELGRILRGEI